MPRFLLICLITSLSTQSAWAEDAVERDGRRHTGRLLHERNRWLFRTLAGTDLSQDALAWVGFDATAFVPTLAPLTKTLHLADGQRLTGSLVRVDDTFVDFQLASGQAERLVRADVVRIVHADDWLPSVLNDFDAPMKTWRGEGGVGEDAKQRFHGKTSLRLFKAGQSVTRTWPALAEGRCTLTIVRTTHAVASRWRIDLLTKAADQPALVIAAASAHCVNVRTSFGSLPITGEMHVIAIERRGKNVRLYLNDSCLGESPLAEGIAGVRVSVDSGGADADGVLWINDLVVARRLPVLPLPRNELKEDSIWLLQGEQLFGKITVADARSVTLDAKFGKRTFPWSQLRGIGFAQKNQNPAIGDTEIEFRPGPGFSADRLRVKLLLWEEPNLLVQHPLLGQLSIERQRLTKVRFEIK